MKLITFIILGIAIIGCSENSKYQIDGEIKNYTGNEEYIYLVKFYSNPIEVDSSKIENGKFSFSGQIDFPEMYAINYHPDRIKGIYEFYIDPGKLKLSIDEENWALGSKISGSTTTDLYNDIFRKYSLLIQELSQKRSALLNTPLL